ncbi:MAG: hypothetical protein IT303_00980 [Dehalococcoidia bacterium]|nr:hypothetical protein [Dehalococcoidia bacterium]
MSGPELGRPFVEAANPAHPSLIDTEHAMDALFGVVNIPNVVWIDEQGMIVRPAEPGWPPPPPERPEGGGAGRVRYRFLEGGQDRRHYADAIRDWAAKGGTSEYALTPDEVIARSQPRPIEVSQAAAEFELGVHLWRAGRRAAAIGHFNAAHRLQPENWTYKRQAWSAVSAERGEGPMALFAQGPADGDTEPWPFDSSFWAEVERLGPDEYYPRTDVVRFPVPSPQRRFGRVGPHPLPPLPLRRARGFVRHPGRRVRAG